MANNHYDLSSIYTAADKYTVLQLLNALLDKVKDLEITDVDVNKTAVNKIKLVFTFADNTTMETPEITLPYEIQNIDITNGHLIFTLESGEIIDAGTLGAVSSFSINSSQHLIVTYQDGTTQDLGAIFQGNVNIAGNFTADSIIENMDGYSIEVGAIPENCVFEKLYYGAVKNGNKLTFVFAFNFTKQTGATVGSFEIGEITIPAAVGSKLYPARIGEYDYLDAKEINCFSTVFGSPIKARCYLQKLNSFTLNGRIFLSEFVPNTKYYCRYETTFLLSDSL